MSRIAWPSTIRALLGFGLGLTFWSLFSPQYDQFLAAAAERVMRTFQRADVTRLNPEGDYVRVDRTDFSPRSPHPTLPVRDLTFNFLILTTLFASEQRPWSDRNVIGFALAAAALTITHVGALITDVMNIYVARLGPWSFSHYGALARNFWGVLDHAYRLVLMYAIAFGLWWVFRARDIAAERLKRRRVGRPAR